MIKLATNKVLTQNPSVPQELSNAKKQEVEKDKELNNLNVHCDELHTQLIMNHDVPPNSEGETHRYLQGVYKGRKLSQGTQEETVEIHRRGAA